MRVPLAFIVVLATAGVDFSAAAAIAPLLSPGSRSASVPPGVPAPGAADAATIADVMAFEKQCDDAAVTGDVAFLERALSSDFVMTHGDGWTTGGAPLKVDTKATWLAYVGKQPLPYVYRNLDSDPGRTPWRRRHHHRAVPLPAAHHLADSSQQPSCMSGSSASTPGRAVSGGSCPTAP